jgi:hypothetical protein
MTEGLVARESNEGGAKNGHGVLFQADPFPAGLHLLASSSAFSLNCLFSHSGSGSGFFRWKTASEETPNGEARILISK